MSENNLQQSEGGITMAASNNLSQYLEKEIHCSCGHTHSTNLRRIDIEEGALSRLPQHIKEFGYKNIFVVCDVNTWEAAGKAAERELEAAGLEYIRRERICCWRLDPERSTTSASL